LAPRVPAYRDAGASNQGFLAPHGGQREKKMEMEKGFSWGTAKYDYLDGVISCEDQQGLVLGTISCQPADWQSILAGADPIKDRWDDGSGQTCAICGWGIEGVQRAMGLADGGDYAEVAPGVLVASQDTMVDDQATWAEDDMAKEMVFTRWLYWLTDDSGEALRGFDTPEEGYRALWG